MKKNFKIYSIVWLVITLIFNVVAFVPSGDTGEFYRYNTEFFAPIFLVDLVFLLQLFLTYLSLNNFDNKTKKSIEELTVLIKNAAFLIILLLACVIVQIFPAIYKWINPIVALLVFVINYIVISKDNESVKTFIIKIKNIFCQRIVKFVVAPSVIAFCVLIALLFTVFIPNIKYSKALKLAENGEYNAACSVFNSISNFKDSKEQINAIIESNPSLSFYKAEIGDTIKYGNYEQDGDPNNGKEEMEWTVIDKKGNKLLLINNYCIEKIAYNNELVNITWAQCSLRKWLNDEFINSAFTDEEIERIDKTYLVNHKNPSYRAPVGGKNTTDRVFVLSYNEANFYLKTEEMIHVKATKYVEEQLAHVSGDTGNAWWWLRTPGSSNSSAVTNHFARNYSIMGYQVNHTAYTVRPCIWINL